MVTSFQILAQFFIFCKLKITIFQHFASVMPENLHVLDFFHLHDLLSMISLVHLQQMKMLTYFLLSRTMCLKFAWIAKMSKQQHTQFSAIFKDS